MTYIRNDDIFTFHTALVETGEVSLLLTREVSTNHGQVNVPYWIPHGRRAKKKEVYLSCLVTSFGAEVSKYICGKLVVCYH